jgi:hypothetical protein
VLRQCAAVPLRGLHEPVTGRPEPFRDRRGLVASHSEPCCGPRLPSSVGEPERSLTDTGRNTLSSERHSLNMPYRRRRRPSRSSSDPLRRRQPTRCRRLPSNCRRFRDLGGGRGATGTTTAHSLAVLPERVRKRRLRHGGDALGVQNPRLPQGLLQRGNDRLGIRVQIRGGRQFYR